MPFGSFRNWNSHSTDQINWPLNDCMQHIFDHLDSPLIRIFSLDTHLTPFFQLASFIAILELLVSFDLHFQSV